MHHSASERPLDPPRVLLLQRVVYPYRLPFFAELGRFVELTVFFCRRTQSDRHWRIPEAERMPFAARLLPAVAAGPVFNFTLPWLLAHGSYDAYVVAGMDRITMPQLVLTLLAAKLRGKPFVYSDEYFETAWERQAQPLEVAVKRLARRLLLPFCDSFIVFNQPARAFLLQLGAPAGLVFCGPHWYPPPQVSLLAPAPQPNGQRTVVSMSRLIHRKGVDDLIKAFRGLPGEHLRLVIAGDGEARVELEEAASGDARIRFVDYVDGPEKDALLRQADLFVLPSLWDPWGLVLNEAMAYGLPLVTTSNVGAAPDLVQDNGAIVPPGDVKALRTAIRRFLEDDDLRAAAGRRSAEIIAGLSLEAMVRPFVDGVRAALTRRGRSRRRC